ncbi:MAG: DUF1819 family protein [Prolixibacteraceae bacterium]|jgi:hypothetical protein|nr:DUF1819 family protein [Prolixibacteraceae bacterium]
MIERNLKYNGTFSSNGVLFNETIRLVGVLKSDELEEALAKDIKENKLLQINSEETRGRAIREIRKRNKYAEPGFWEDFSRASEEEQRLMFFYLCLKTYRILFDLHFLVTVKRYHIDTTVPETFYYKMVTDELASIDKTVAAWSDTTLKKTLSNYRSLLRVAGLLKGDQLTTPFVPASFWTQFTERNEYWFLEACFQSIK